MTGLKTVYDKTGRVLTDFRAKVVRSSIINDIGEASFEISYDDSKCRQEYFNFGNFVVVQEVGLPTWVGVIDLPRVWHNNYLEVNAYEVSLLLKYRFAPLNTVLEGGAGAKVAELIQMANNQGDTLISMGQVVSGGVPSSEKYNGSIFSHLASLAQNNGHDWILTPTISQANQLRITLDWKERIAVNTDLILRQGDNVLYGEIPLEETGELISHVEVATDIDSSEEGLQVVMYQEAVDYGIRAQRVVLDGSVTSAGLLTFAEQIVKDKKNPSLSTPLTIINKDGKVFPKIALGNVVTYEFPRLGFSSQLSFGMTKRVRIMGYRYDERTDLCELFVGEV